MQTTKALTWLQRESIDQAEARTLGIVDLNAVISKLRKAGHKIGMGTKPIPLGDGLQAWVAEYYLER